VEKQYTSGFHQQTKSAGMSHLEGERKIPMVGSTQMNLVEKDMIARDGLLITAVLVWTMNERAPSDSQ